MSAITPEQFDALLPQTQCGLCGHGGCMPYAEALVFEGAAINLCPPGGVETLTQLGDLLGQDPSPFLADMADNTKSPSVAIIREDECIGCTKCIQVCPVDAILGSGKTMHTIIADECTGCELCIPPCPVDCIDLVSLPDESRTENKKNTARIRFQDRNLRLQQQLLQSKQKKISQSRDEKQHYIQQAIARASHKKSP
jgi:electron transport complex protein RnfB